MIKVDDTIQSLERALMAKQGPLASCQVNTNTKKKYIRLKHS